MELPNYSRQLMQQLHTLRKDGRFCDCTILIGTALHRAHKLVLAASSLLFKSLMEGSDTISIDSSVVTSQEFSCLLEMIYTGKLPPGKHNFTRIIAAADSLQMFDVAVSCKNILNDLIKSPATTEPLADATDLALGGSEHTSSPVAAVPSSSEAAEVPIDPTPAAAQEEMEGGSTEATCEKTGNPPVDEEENPAKNGDSAIPRVWDSSVENSPPCKRGRLALTVTKEESEEYLEFLQQNKNKIAGAIGNVQPVINAVEKWEEISSVEKLVILDCCKGEPDVTDIFHSLLNYVVSKKLSTRTLLTLLEALRELCPDLATVLENPLQGEQNTERDAHQVPDEKPASRLLVDHAEELIVSISHLSPIIEVLDNMKEDFLTETEKQTVFQCCRDVCTREAIQSLLNKVKVEKVLEESSFLKLLHAVKSSFPVLQKLLDTTVAEGTTFQSKEDRGQEEYETDLLRRYHQRLSESICDPQPLLESLAAADDVSAEDQKWMKQVLEEGASPCCLDRLLSLAVEKGSVQVLAVWKLLVRTEIPALGLLIQDIRKDPEADRFIHSVLDLESQLLEILSRHKDLITETISSLGTLLDSVAGEPECPSGDAIEFIKNCSTQVNLNESVKTLLDKILHEKSMAAQPFCKLVSLNKGFFPSLRPLADELEQAGELSDMIKVPTNQQHVKQAWGYGIEGHTVNLSCKVVKYFWEGEKDPGDGAEKKGGKKGGAKQSFPCEWCGKTFEFKCRMEVHRKRCRLSEQTQLKCPQCPEKMSTPKALQQHLAKSHGSPPRKRKKRRHEPVTCDICGKSFAHQSGMLYHKRTDHFDEKPYSCEECGAKFAANSTLKNHMRLHTGEKPFFCKHCDMTFTQAAALAYHYKKKHSEGKMYACQYCEAVFAQSIELTRHVRTHTGDKPYVCRECGKGFSQANGLSMHLQTFHNIDDPYDCQKCRMSFSCLEEHRKHIQESHPKEFHPCVVCGKIFNAAALLEKHMVIHVGGKPYSCEICNKAYQQVSGLWYHNRTNHPEVFAGQSHRSVKISQFQCSSCDKTFPSSETLSKHEKAMHPDVKLFKCQDCEDVFPDAELLKTHTKEKHEGAQLFNCLYCPSSFQTTAELQQHLCVQHFNQQGEAFGCGHCDLIFPSQQELQEHFLSQHPAELQASSEASSAQMVIRATEQPGAAEQMITLEQSQLGSPQVYVTLADSQNSTSGSEIVAVNVEDLLDGTVTFICEDTQ
ncbi:ZBT40 protein, partial [Atractosteus spatula]|nr:ZBT40 protein [Atractosteus spatula]